MNTELDSVICQRSFRTVSKCEETGVSLLLTLTNPAVSGGLGHLHGYSLSWGEDLIGLKLALVV